VGCGAGNLRGEEMKRMAPGFFHFKVNAAEAMFLRRRSPPEGAAPATALPSDTPFPLAPVTPPYSTSWGLVADMRADVLGLGRCVENEWRGRGGAQCAGGVFVSRRPLRGGGEIYRNWDFWTATCAQTSSLPHRWVLSPGTPLHHPLSAR